MAEYRKKPVVIEAVQWSGYNFFETLPDGRAVEPSWIYAALATGDLQKMPSGGLWITTLEGIHVAQPGDYIVMGVERGLYACKPQIFERTYELVD